MPTGRRRSHDGRGRRQGDRPARHLLRHPRPPREREAFQELDYRAVFGSMTKWATEIDDPARVPEIVSRAFHVAANGRPGPVVVGIPEDMLVERVAVSDAPPFALIETSPGDTEMAKFAQMLAGARAPIMLLGGSRWSQGASDGIGRLVPENRV